MVLRTKTRYTADDLWKTPDDGNRYEVIEGKLFVMPPPGWGHQRALNTLLFVLTKHIYDHRLGEIVPAPVGVVLDDENAFEPDIVFIGNQRRQIISERGVEGAPDLVVEVLSPSTQARDRGKKMRRYAAAGVPYYWMLNYRARWLEAYRLGEAGYELVGRFSPGDTFRPVLFPGLEIAIADLLV